MQIATVDGNGLPHCRTVVFRGFQSSTAMIGLEALRMITDSRSEKVAHIQKSPACEMVWWFSQTSEQYRIAGELQVVGPEADDELQAARKEQWEKLSDPAREQFWWPTPGVDFSGSPEVPKGGKDGDGKMLPIPDYFRLLLLWPCQIKYLRLTDNYSVVDDFDAASRTWKPMRVNP